MSSRTIRSAVRRRAHPGEAQAWLEGHLAHPLDTDECVIYPFATSAGAVYRGQSVPRLLLGLEPGDGLVARHTCHIAACVNRRHLTTGTPADNSRDMIDAGRSLTGARNPNFGLSITKGRNPHRQNPAIRVQITA